VIVGFGLVAACAIALVLLVKGLYPADLPESRSPDFVDNIFDNRGVLWAARLLLYLLRVSWPSAASSSSSQSGSG